uniref:Uncharacterized protein n=1 Tax=Anguilla anguilla TaxID=7936 RepID=A0A0E9VM80_ANGAN
MRRLYYKKRHYQLSCKCTLRTPPITGLKINKTSQQA